MRAPFILETESGLIHATWLWKNAHGLDAGEVRFFLRPLAPRDPATGQPQMRWTWGCNLSCTPQGLHISMVQSFTLPAGPGHPYGTRVPMPPRLRQLIVRDLQRAAELIEYPEILWDDWQPGGRIRKARLGRRAAL